MKYYRTTAHSKYDLKVHVVFIPKYRKKVLTGEVAVTVRDLIRQICSENDVEVISRKVAKDHVHLFVSYPPHLSISKMMQKIKGKSAYKIFSLHPKLQQQFWARGYLAVSSGNITDELIQQYIESQTGEDIHHGPINIDS